MLISLKSGAVGLDLTVANYVFLVGPSNAADISVTLGGKEPLRGRRLIAHTGYCPPWRNIDGRLGSVSQ